MGHPLVLLHGMWSNASHLQRLQRLLAARGYDCHVPTLPHHEPAPAQAEQVGAQSLRDYVQALEAFIAERNFAQPPVLLGHSMGGLLAQLLACRVQPAALVLLTPAAPAGIHMLNGDVLRAALPWVLRWNFWQRPHALSLATFKRNAMNCHSPADAEKMHATLVAESGRATFETALWWADGPKASAVAAEQVRCPVYVVSAGKDGLTPSAAVKKVAARYANSTLRIWPDRDHWVIDDDDTEGMVHEIDGWLRPILARLNKPQAVRKAA